MTCQIHDCEMEWIVESSHPEGGYWFCQECWDDDEERAYGHVAEGAWEL
jgi:hypothetical protein